MSSRAKTGTHKNGPVGRGGADGPAGRSLDHGSQAVCVRAFLAGIEARAGTFLCRYHKGLPVTALAPARFVGSIETGNYRV